MELHYIHRLNFFQEVSCRKWTVITNVVTVFLFLRGDTLRKKLFRRIYNADYIPDDELLHIFFDSSMIRLDITAYDSTLSKTYAKFFDAYSQAKLKNVFSKDWAAFIDSFLVDPHNFDINTCNPFNTTDDRYYFNYEGDEAYTYIWLVKMGFCFVAV